MMETIARILAEHGYVVLAAVGFGEYVGVPIASVPVLVTAGALAGNAGLHPLLVAAAAAGGGLAADVLWFSVSRWQGQRVVGTACGLTSNPGACVLGVRSRVERLGTPYLLMAKFLPGAGNLVAAGAGLSGLPFPRFLLADAAGLALWASVYVALGRLFSDQVEGLLGVLAAYVRGVGILALGLVLLAGIWRVVRSRRHGHHRSRRSTAAGPRGSAPEAGSEREAT